MPDNARAQRALIVIFIGLIWLPLGSALVMPEQTVSMAEKRRLAAWPALDWGRIEEYPKAFENYYNDHFGFRSRLIRWYNIVKVRWLKVSNSQWVLVGRDGWLFQGGSTHFKDMQNALPFAETELRRWGEVLQRKHDWLRGRGIEYLFVITPNKHLVYPEMLPAQVRAINDRGRIDQLVDHLRAHTSVPVVDLRAPLLASRRQFRPYNRTDTHWNSFGAYVGYREVMARLLPALPDLEVLNLSPEWVARERAGGDLANALNLADVLREQHIEHRDWQPSCARDVELDTGADNRIRNQQAFTTVCDRATRSLLMFRDSFSLEMMPYLSESFASAHYFPASPVPLAGLQRLVAEKQPDVVIEQRSSRWLRTPEG